MDRDVATVILLGVMATLAVTFISMLRVTDLEYKIDQLQKQLERLADRRPPRLEGDE